MTVWASLVPVGGVVAPAVGQGQLHVEAGPGAQSGDVELRIQDLHLAVGLDVACGDFALAAGFNIHRLDSLAVELGDDGLDVEDDLGDIFLHAGNGAEFVLDPGDLDGGHRGAGQGGEEHPPQGVAQSGAIAPLQRLHHVLAVGVVAHVLLTVNAGFFDFNHRLPSF